MPNPHEKNHNAARGMVIRNVILGGQDGLVNVLGIVLGVATATNSNQIVLLAGLAATFAESVSMAAVAYTSSKAEAEHYSVMVKQEFAEIEKDPKQEREEVAAIYREKGFSGKLLDQIVDKICSDKKVWVQTMMREELRLQNPEDGMSPLKQGVLVGVSAIIGSVIPVAPFFFLPVSTSTLLALVLSLVVLFVAGAYKSHLTERGVIRGGFELMIIGGFAALAGYLVGVFFNVKV
ncbi:VIT1/CCC1 transporter family protein [Candidatus Micrarchaeota archaeon]|nr:VIT1/CCC1 transporter family protein [Candidatus Micrarchaeota archaeon]